MGARYVAADHRVVGRHVFYDDSAYDRPTPANPAGDDDAIAPDKAALLPGSAAGFANVTSYSRGVNGVMVDLLGASEAFRAGPAATDFVFETSGAPGVAQWAAAVAPAITVRQAQGTAGSDRVVFTWPDDGAARNTWLRVTVKAGSRSGLARPDVFYFGNLAGDTGNDRGTPIVNASDMARIRAAVGRTTPAALATYDFNRDRRIDAHDVAIVRANQRHTLPLFDAPSAAQVSVASIPTTASRTTRPARRGLLGERPQGLLI